MKKNIGYILGAVLLVGFITYKAIEHQGALKERAKQSEVKLKASQDSLKMAQTSLANAQIQLIEAVSRLDTMWKIRTVFVKSADVSGVRADAAIIRAGTDSLSCPNLQVAYNERTTECKELRRALVADSIAIRATRDTLVQVKNILAGTERQVVDVHTMLRNATKPYVCKIVGLFPCVSRTWVFIGGVAAGAGASYLLRN